MTTATLTDADLATISSSLESAAARRVISMGGRHVRCRPVPHRIDDRRRAHRSRVGVDPNIEIVFIDTQYHFAETLDGRRVRSVTTRTWRILSPIVSLTTCGAPTPDGAAMPARSSRSTSARRQAGVDERPPRVDDDRAERAEPIVARRHAGS